MPAQLSKCIQLNKLNELNIISERYPKSVAETKSFWTKYKLRYCDQKYTKEEIDTSSSIQTAWLGRWTDA